MVPDSFFITSKIKMKSKCSTFYVWNQIEFKTISEQKSKQLRKAFY